MGARKVIAGLAGKLKAARAAAGLSQEQAGEKSGVHPINIAKFETEKSVPTLGTLYQLAAAYGVNVCDLLPGGESGTARLPPGTVKRTPALPPTPPRPAGRPQKTDALAKRAKGKRNRTL